MTRVSIRAYIRRSKKGKPIRVQSHNRSVGHKGVHTPMSSSSEQSGKEFERKVSERKESSALTMDEKERREIIEGFRQAEAERKALGLTREQYSWRVTDRERRKSQQEKEQQKQQRRAQKAAMVSPTRAVNRPLTPKGSLGILERVEDKVARFVEKYSGVKYKRQL